MNVNMLITENNFAGTRGTSPVPSTPDASKKDAKFSLTTDDKHSQVNNLEKPTADYVRQEVQNRKEPVNKSPQDFTQSNHKKTKSENPCEAENKTNPKEENAASGTIKQANKQQNSVQSSLAEHFAAVEQSEEDNATKKGQQNLIKSFLAEHFAAVEQSEEGNATKKGQQNLIKSFLAEHSLAVEQSKEGTATKIEPKVGRQLAQIISNTQTGKSPSVTGNAVKSAEIKLLHTTEKGQLGLKTVLPATSEGQNGLKAVLPDTSKNIPADKKQPVTGNNTDKVSILARTIAETKSVTEKGNTKELMPEVPANTGKSTNVSSGKPAAGNINLTTVQSKASQTQPQPAGINPEKPVPTVETEAKTIASQTLSKVLNPNGKETTLTGNNLSEIHAAQKLNIASVQVSTDQAKDQGTSTSNKNASQGFEQMLSHNTSQTLFTEQTPAAIKNTTTANMPGQTSSSNVSADIGRQILESIHSSISKQGTERQITIRLNPPELGKVFITFRQQDSELTGLMEVSKPQTRFEIEQTMPQIIRNLADSGIQIKRFEVMLSNEGQTGQGTLGNQSMQSGGAHQQNSANHGMPGYNPDADESNEWLASNNSYENLYEFQEGFVTDGSINMLI